MREVWITDAGVVTAAGNNLEETWYGILSGKTAIREINRFPVKAYRSGIGASIPDIKPSGASFIINEPYLSGIAGLYIAMDSIAREGHGAIITGICDAGVPPPLVMTRVVIPGALFFVLQRAPEGQYLSYGELTQDKMNRIFFNGKKIDDLNTLAVMCTEAFHAKKGDSRET